MKIHKKQPLSTQNSSTSKIPMPRAVVYIMFSEAIERFCYYGMSVILITLMTRYLVNNFGNRHFTESQTMVWYHCFIAACYSFSVIGGLIADILYGKYKTAIAFSILCCFGYLILIIFNTKVSFILGLTLIAIGLGGIRPCIASQLGDQFNQKNHKIIDKAYGYFYFAINVGYLISLLLTPYLLREYGHRIAFTSLGTTMLVSTFIFYKGRKAFNAIPSLGWKKFKKEFGDKNNRKAIKELCIILVFVAIFYSIWNQYSSSWVIQAGKMNREINLGFFKYTPDQSQIQIINPILVLILTPLFYYVAYPFLEKFTSLTHLKKSAIGFFLIGFSFAIVAFSQMLIEQSKDVSIYWQVVAFILLTAAEILVLANSFELIYLKSPNSMKSLICGLYLLATGIGNLITAIINYLLQDEYGNSIIDWSTYFWIMAVFVTLTGIFLMVCIPYCKGKNYLQLSTIRQIIDIILNTGKGKICCVMLSGSFASRNLSKGINLISDMKYEHDDSYNFLIITKDKNKIGTIQTKSLRDRIRYEFINWGFGRFINLDSNKAGSVTIDIKSLYTLKLELGQNQYFNDLKKESIFIYGSQDLDLSELGQYSKIRMQQIAKEGYSHWYKKGADSLKIVKASKSVIDDLGLIAVNLHQAAESFYNSCLLVLTGNKPRSHELKERIRLIAIYTDQFDDIFPTDTKEGEYCFNLLEKSYADGRYNPFFQINKEQLNYLIERVEALKEATKNICEKQIESLNQYG